MSTLLRQLPNQPTFFVSLRMLTHPMKYRLIYFALSLLVIIPGVISLLKFGLKPSIDFTGGTVWEIKINTEKPQPSLEESLSDDRIVTIEGRASSFIIHAKPLSQEEHLELKQTLEEKVGEIEEIRFETVGPTLGKELLQKTLIAVAIAATFILLFIAWRFRELTFGLAALIAMFHDTFILAGVFSILGVVKGIEVDTLFVTAVLTVLSFSVHDTIVVFDRIRESRRLYPQASFEALVNKSVVETLARSINNSMTIIFMLLSLYLLGGDTTKNFALALLIGTITGTYSSTFTAAPLLVIFEKRKHAH